MLTVTAPVNGPDPLPVTETPVPAATDVTPLTDDPLMAVVILP